MTVGHILVPTDRSPCAERAFVPAVSLARRWGARLTGVHIWVDPAAPPSGRLRGMQESGHGVAESKASILDVEASDVASAIVHWATEAELVVMGTHGRGGFSRLRLGSVAEAVARTSPCPVLLVPMDAAVEEGGFRQILAAVDPEGLSSDLLPSSIQWAMGFAKAFGAHLDALAVVDRAGAAAYPSLRHAASTLASLTARGTRSVSEVSMDYVVRQGDPVEEVVAEAHRLNADLLVVGARSRQGIGWFLGSVAEAIVRRAPCPVLVVPPGASIPNGAAQAARLHHPDASSLQVPA